jgi:hypothetical protein
MLKILHNSNGRTLRMFSLDYPLLYAVYDRFCHKILTKFFLLLVDGGNLHHLQLSSHAVSSFSMNLHVCIF